MVMLPGPAQVPNVSPSIQRGSTPAIGASNPSAVGEALTGFGGAIGNVANVFARQAERIRSEEERAAAKKQAEVERAAREQQDLTDTLGRGRPLLQFRESAASELERLTSQRDLSDTSVLADYGSTLAAAKEAALKTAPPDMTGRARALLELDLDEETGRYTQQLEKEHLTRLRTAAADVTEAQINAIAAGVQRKPGTLAAAFPDLDKAVDSLPAAVRHDATVKGYTSLITAAVDGHIEAGNTKAALAIAKDPAFDELFTPPQRAAMIDRVQREAERRQNQAKADVQFFVSSRMDDAKAAAGDGKDPFAILPPAAITAAYGEQRGSAVIQDLREKQRGGEQLQAIALMPAPEVAQLLERMRPSLPGVIPEGLSQQERFLYQRHLDNLLGQNGGQAVRNADGSTSTLFASTFEVDGKAYIIPTVWGGKILPPRDAFSRAREVGLDKFPSYASQEAADARYGQLHALMEHDVTSLETGYANQAAAYTATTRAVAERERMLKDDAAGYVLKNAPAVQAAAAKAFGPGATPADMASYTAGMLETQAYLGVPEYERKVLTKTQADNLAASVAAADTAQGRLDAAAKVWSFGTAAHSVTQQLTKAGAPKETPYALEAMQAGNTAGARRIFQAGLTKVPLTPAERGDLNGYVASAMGDYTEVLATAAKWTGDPLYLGAAHQFAELSVGVAAVSGVTRANASSAVKDVLGHLKPIMENDLAAVLVPVGTDEAKLTAALRTVREQLTLANLPADALPAEKSLAAASAAQSHWVNVGDRFALVLPSGAVAQAPDGKPLTYDLNGLMREAAHGGR